MEKLLAAYLADSTDANAHRIAQYRVKHPMAEIMLVRDDYATMTAAVNQAKNAK
jgi:hypothetical protein